jgi:L-threonylcarbamoyladenylate synthase
MKLPIISQDNATAVGKAVETLKKGGLIVAPSDTVYGALVDATNEKAVKKLIQFKNRPAGKSISVFTNGLEMMASVVSINEKQQEMLQTLLPGPFTVVLPSKHVVSPLLEAEDRTLGVRYITYTLINEIVSSFGKPVTATSANLAGLSSNHSVESLLNQLSDTKKELIDLIIDAGQLPRNKPSTVLNLTTPTVKVIRQGDLSWAHEEVFQTQNEEQTKQVSRKIFEKINKKVLKEKPLVIILKGDLGAGKTVFVKGLAEELKIKENIISPTFTIYYEYKIEDNSLFSNLYHFDLYNIESAEEYEHLGIDQYLKPGNILSFEWGDKAGDLIEKFKEKACVFFVEINYLSEKEREVKLNV